VSGLTLSVGVAGDGWPVLSLGLSLPLSGAFSDGHSVRSEGLFMRCLILPFIPPKCFF
jgi:hypothetical protein